MCSIGRETRTIDVDDDNDDGTFVHASGRARAFCFKVSRSLIQLLALYEIAIPLAAGRLLELSLT
jgi:hypothetical protein